MLYVCVYVCVYVCMHMDTPRPSHLLTTFTAENVRPYNKVVCMYIYMYVLYVLCFMCVCVCVCVCVYAYGHPETEALTHHIYWRKCSPL